MKHFRIDRGPDEMHAAQMLGYGNRYRELKRRRRNRITRWGLRWPQIRPQRVRHD